MHIVEHYLVHIKKEILLCEIIWMNLKDIMLIEIRWALWCKPVILAIWEVEIGVSLGKRLARFHLNQRLDVMATPVIPGPWGRTNRKIAFQASLGINMRPYLKKQCKKGWQSGRVVESKKTQTNKKK
jgi:hypothetical protein